MGKGDAGKIAAVKYEMPPIAKPKRIRNHHFLREWRQHRGYNQQKAADLIGVSQGFLSRVERLEAPYDQDFLELAAEAYSTDPASLLMRNPKNQGAIWSLWESATPAQRETLASMAEVLLKKAS